MAEAVDDRGSVKTFEAFGGGQKSTNIGALSQILRRLCGKTNPDFAYKRHLQESPGVFTQPGPKADMPENVASTFIGVM